MILYSIPWEVGEVVQQLIGVDKVFTRAIEKILKSEGLSLAKVTLLYLYYTTPYFGNVV